MNPTEDSVERSQYLTFQVGRERCAVGILQVREIIGHREPTRVPMTPPHVPGVINLRGSVVPVVDLGKKFGLPAVVVSKRTCIVIADVAIDDEPTVMGLLVDSVDAVADLAEDQIESPPAFGLGVSSQYLRGMGRVGEAFVSILDLDRLLSAGDALSEALDR